LKLLLSSLDFPISCFGPSFLSVPQRLRFCASREEKQILRFAQDDMSF